VLSPDGSRFAVLASPRPPDPLADVHAVVEPDETSLYVVNRDGTGGTRWCSSLKNIADSGLAGSEVSSMVPRWVVARLALKRRRSDFMKFDRSSMSVARLGRGAFWRSVML
jgi:hypothetical protein